AVAPRGPSALGRMWFLAARSIALMLQLSQELVEDLDQMDALRIGTGTPVLVVGALVGELELVSRHRGRVVVGVELGDRLLGDEVPMVFGPHRPPGSLRRLACPPLGDGILDLPLIGSDLLFVPLAPVVVPLVCAADTHTRVPLPVKVLRGIVRSGHVR